MKRGRTPALPVPRLSRSQILLVAQNLVQSYVGQVGQDHLLKHGMSFSGLYDTVIYPHYEVTVEEGRDLGVDDQGKKILGAYHVRDNTVLIDRVVGVDTGDSRRTFTLYHEVVGHAVLQGGWLREHAAAYKNLTTNEDGLQSNAREMLERQANLCASHCAAPAWLVEAAICQIYRPTKRFVYFRPSVYCLNPRGMCTRIEVDSFHALGRAIARHIQPWFDGLSIEALGYRVSASRWLVDKAEPDLALLRVAG